MSKRKVLTFNKKIRVLELSKSTSARNIANEFGDGKPQFCKFQNKRKQIKHILSKTLFIYLIFIQIHLITKVEILVSKGDNPTSGFKIEGPHSS